MTPSGREPPFHSRRKRLVGSFSCLNPGAATRSNRESKAKPANTSQPVHSYSFPFSLSLPTAEDQQSHQVGSNLLSPSPALHTELEMRPMSNLADTHPYLFFSSFRSFSSAWISLLQPFPLRFRFRHLQPIISRKIRRPPLLLSSTSAYPKFYNKQNEGQFRASRCSVACPLQPSQASFETILSLDYTLLLSLSLSLSSMTGSDSRRWFRYQTSTSYFDSS